MGIDIRDVPQEMLAQIHRRVESDPQVRQLRIEQRIKQEKGDLMGALRIGMALEEIFAKVTEAYLVEAANEVETFTIAQLDIPEEGKEKILTLGIVIFMASDLMESATQDVNDTLRKYEKDIKFEMFDDITESMKAVKEKLSYFEKTTDYMDDNVWGDSCDNLYEMAQSKARALIRKRKESKNWGKNAEKYKK